MALARGTRREGMICRAIATAATMAVVIALGSCRKLPPLRSDASSGSLRVGTAQLSASNPIAGLRQLSQLLTVEGLVRVGENGRLEPVLAEKWSLANGGRSFLLTLRPNVRFHDGSVLDSNAVVRSGGFHSVRLPVSPSQRLPEISDRALESLREVGRRLPSELGSGQR